MKKNQIIILVVVIVLIFGGIIGWVISQKSKLPAGEGIAPEGEKTFLEEMTSLTGTVTKVDVENNFLLVKPTNQEKEVKAVLSEATELIKLTLPPFDPENPPKVAIQTKIEISDFKVGDNIFIKTTENIAGKSEFDDVDFIHIMP